MQAPVAATVFNAGTAAFVPKRAQALPVAASDDDDDGGIIGVYSLARGRPLKQANFDSRYQDFERRQTYAEWLFVRPADPAATGLRSGLVEGGVLRMQERVPARSVAPWPSEDDKETSTGLSGTSDGR